MFGGCVFQQTVGIPVGTKVTPLLVDLFINLHESDIIKGFSSETKKKLTRSFNFTVCFVDHYLSLFY